MSVRRTEAESASLRAIWTRDLLDSQPEVECEELVQLAAAICGTPAGLVTLLDERYQWFRASAHLKLGETPREVAFCAHAIREAGLVVVKDSLMDPRFANNPLVMSDPAIRFFAGVGLFREDGEPLGTLSVVDMTPKILAAEQANALEVLGRQVSVRLEAMVQRKALAEVIAEKEKASANLRASEELFRAFMNASPFLSYIKDAAGRLLFYNRSFAQRFGVSEYAWLGRTDEQLWSRKLTKSMRTHDLEVMAGGRMVETEEHIRNSDGTVSSLRSFKFPCHDSAGNVLLAGVAVFMAMPRLTMVALVASTRRILQLGQMAEAISRSRLISSSQPASIFFAGLATRLRSSSVLGPAFPVTKQGPSKTSIWPICASPSRPF